MKYRTEVLWAEWSDMPVGWSIRKHSHTFYHLFYAKSGTATFFVEGRPVSLERGDLMIVPPGVEHELPGERHSLVTFYEIKFAVNDPQLRPVCGEGDVIVRENFQRYEELLRYIAFHWSYSDKAILTNLDSLLSAILLAVSLDGANISSLYVLVDGYSRLTQQMILYVEQNCLEQFTLQMLADALGKNAHYLCGVFKKDTGSTINEYLNFVRVRRVITSLFYAGDSNLEINLIAQAAGFTNISHFNRVFKKYTGMTPSHFRKAYVRPGGEGTSLGEEAKRMWIYYDNVFSIRARPIAEAMFELRHLEDQAAASPRVKRQKRKNM